MVSNTTPVNTKCKRNDIFGKRLVLERDRLKLKQVDVCALTGVSKTTQIKYESGERMPDIEYLCALNGRDFDVQFIVTGHRSTDAMSDEHQNLIEAYEAAPDDLKRAAFAVLLSIWKKGYLDKPQKEPGYFQHQILGEDDVRYENFKKPTMLLAAEPNQEPPPDDSTVNRK